MSLRKVSWFLLIVLAIGMVPWPRAMSLGPPESETIHITDTHDDGFVTEAGIGIDSSLVHILDPGMDLRAFLVFRGVEINWWEPLTNATLRIRSASSLAFDADSSVTVYGIKLSDLQLEGWLGPAFIMSTPLTTAHVNVNTSQFYGSTWLDIDVANIIEELIRHPEWDGDGSDGTEPGDDVGFIFLGDQDEKRYFYDYLGNPSYSADLIMWWNVEPPPPSAGAPGPYNDTSIWEWEFVNTSDRGPDIWKVTDYGETELFYISASSMRFHNETTGPDGTVNWAPGGGFQFSSAGELRQIERLDPWVFLLGDNGSTTVYYSDDEFSPGSIRVSEANNQYPILDNFAGNIGSIHLDQNDTQTLHVVWTTVTWWQPGTYNVVYSNFTILADGTLDWADTFVNITNVGTEQFTPELYSQQDGTLHIVWYGHQGQANDQIWYIRRYPNGTWGPQVRVSDADVYNSWEPDVVAHEETGDALVAWTMNSVPNSRIQWDIVFPNNTDGPDRSITTTKYVSLVNERENNVAHMAYDTDVGNPSVDYRFKSIDNSSAWSGAQDVSPNGEKHFYPSISLDEANETLAVIWWNDWNTRTAHNEWQIGDAPVVGKATIANIVQQYPSSPEYHGRHISQVVYFTSWPNGTIMDGPFDTEDEAETGIEVDLGPHPEDPDPVTDEWPETGPFTRFKTRAYFFIVGFFCVWGPIWFFAWKRPSGYYILGGLLVMLIGVGLIIHVATI